ncbi:MAG TPA: 2OG-Fe(II) oxygenase [Rudaea sp.]|jgi:hypothetical protein
MVYPEVHRLAHSYAQSFRGAEPFRHVVIENFFEPAVCRTLLDEFPRFEDRYALNEMGEVGGKAVRMNVRDVSDSYRALDRYLQTPGFLDLVSTITGISDLLYDPDYIGGGTHENRDGQSLDAHVDFNYHPRTKAHRRLNLIVYLNEEWEEPWGGALELHSNPWSPAANQTRHVLPLFNRAVIFETSENSWHGFSRINLPEDRKALSRKSFAIYLYTKERPAAETAAPHATIYVPDALPQSLVAGQTLDCTDVAELQGRFTRLRTQLRYLYDREKQFGAQIAAAETALDEVRAALRMPLQGYATQSVAPQGMWPDHWAGAEFTCDFVVQRKARALELDLWIPDQIEGDQALDIELAGNRSHHVLARGRRSRIVLKVAIAAGADITLRIRSSRQFVPARIGESGDERQLAFRLLGAALEH